MSAEPLVVYVLHSCHFSHPDCDDRRGIHPPHKRDAPVGWHVVGVFTDPVVAAFSADLHSDCWISWEVRLRPDSDLAYILVGWAGPLDDPRHWQFAIEPWYLNGGPVPQHACAEASLRAAVAALEPKSEASL